VQRNRLFLLFGAVCQIAVQFPRMTYDLSDVERQDKLIFVFMFMVSPPFGADYTITGTVVYALVRGVAGTADLLAATF
jgi:hypothetical protein